MPLIHYDVFAEDTGDLGVCYKLYQTDHGVPVGECLLFGFGSNMRGLAYDIAGYMIDQQWIEQNKASLVTDSHMRSRILNIVMHEHVLAYHPIYHLINWEWFNQKI